MKNVVILGVSSSIAKQVSDILIKNPEINEFTREGGPEKASGISQKSLATLILKIKVPPR